MPGAGKGRLKDKHGPTRGLELWAAERWPRLSFPGGPWSLGGEGEKLALTQLWAVGWGGPEGGCPEHSGAFPPVFAVYNQRPSPELLSPPPRDNEVLLRISFTKHFADDIC